MLKLLPKIFHEILESIYSYSNCTYSLQVPNIYTAVASLIQSIPKVGLDTIKTFPAIPAPLPSTTPAHCQQLITKPIIDEAPQRTTAT